MKEAIVSFKTAKLAKKKGYFDPVSYQCYMAGTQKLHRVYTEDLHPDNICAPTQALLAQWLREVHHIHVYITPEFYFGQSLEGYNVNVDRFIETSKHVWIHDERYHDLNSKNLYISKRTYEQALERGLQIALKLIKDGLVSNS